MSNGDWSWASVAERLASWRDEVGGTKLTALGLTLLAAMIVVLWGRGDSHRAGDPKLVSVRGVVTVDGRPVTAGTITFIPDDTLGTRGPMSTGVLHDDGHYELLAPRGRRGAGSASRRDLGADHRKRRTAYRAAARARLVCASAIVGAGWRRARDD